MNDTPAEPRPEDKPAAEPAPARQPEAVTPPSSTPPEGQQPQPPSVSPEQPYPYAQQENPGQVLGILSIIAPFIGFSAVGIVLGAVSLSKSKKAHMPTTLGTVGLIVSIVITVLAIVGAMLYILAFGVAYSGVQERARQAEEDAQVRQQQRQESMDSLDSTQSQGEPQSLAQ